MFSQRNNPYCENPRPYERGDQISRDIEEYLVKFQSTPLREGRPLTPVPSIVVEPFQSTPLREGRLVVFVPYDAQQFCFNPRPYERGDIDALEREIQQQSFNPRPYERGD